MSDEFKVGKTKPLSEMLLAIDPSIVENAKERALEIIEQEDSIFTRLRAKDLDAQRYRWLKEHVFEVLCEGRPADCNAKWMLPRLVAEDSTGRKFTFDEIIDIQMKRGRENV
jgi:hypothetical protein